MEEGERKEEEILEKSQEECSRSIPRPSPSPPLSRSLAVPRDRCVAKADVEVHHDKRLRRRRQNNSRTDSRERGKAGKEGRRDSTSDAGGTHAHTQAWFIDRTLRAEPQQQHQRERERESRGADCRYKPSTLSRPRRTRSSRTLLPCDPLDSEREREKDSQTDRERNRIPDKQPDARQPPSAHRHTRTLPLQFTSCSSVTPSFPLQLKSQDTPRISRSKGERRVKPDSASASPVSSIIWSPLRLTQRPRSPGQDSLSGARC